MTMIIIILWKMIYPHPCGIRLRTILQSIRTITVETSVKIKMLSVSRVRLYFVLKFMLYFFQKCWYDSFFFFFCPTGLHFCRGTFDGWLCWADTEAGVTVHQPCPQFISGFDPASEFYPMVFNVVYVVRR